MAMNLEFRQSLRMEQKLQQSPQMIQAMQVLQLTTHELMDRINAQLHVREISRQLASAEDSLQAG